MEMKLLMVQVNGDCVRVHYMNDSDTNDDSIIYDFTSQGVTKILNVDEAESTKTLESEIGELRALKEQDVWLESQTKNTEVGGI